MSDPKSAEAIVFFATVDAFTCWMEQYAAATQELWVGYYKKGSGQASITWPESVDVALCFGWIDGLRKTIDEQRYRIRFTPRLASSNWSAVNIARVAALTAEGRMRPAGLEAFARRREDRTAVYSYEQRHDAALGPEFAAQFQANHAAWDSFSARPPSYRQAAIRWVMSAKKSETRWKRLENLIVESAAGQTIKELTPPRKRRSMPEASDMGEPE